LPECATADLAWREHPVWTAEASGRPPEAREGLVCKAIEIAEAASGGARFAVTRANLYARSADGPEGRGVQLPLDLVTVYRRDGERDQLIGRVLLPIDISRGEPVLDVSVVESGGRTVLRLGHTVAELQIIDGDRLRAVPALAWSGSIPGYVPAGQVAGMIVRLDLARMLGLVALHRSTADPDSPLPSAFDPGRLLAIRLAWEGDRLVANGADVVDREPGLLAPLQGEAEIAAEQAALAAGRAKLPAGTEPCDLGAWSADNDAAGLNVRAEPSARARVLGKLPPPRKFPRNEAAPPEGLRSTFRIVGYRDGWFLIEGAKPPGGEDYPRGLPRPYSGRGWISARMAGAAFANSGLGGGWLWLSPHADAATRPAKSAAGEPISVDGGPKRILACSGLWALVESGDGTRGWWRRLCSSQVANCS
jgi:hypothetical protein